MRSSLPSFALRVLTLTLLVLLTLASQAPAQTTVQIHMVAGSSPIVGTAATKTLPYSPYYRTPSPPPGPPAPASFPPPAPSPQPTAP